MTLFFYIISLLISFYLLARVCDEYFIEALSQIADKLKMSSDVAGATLMAIGSSAPELFVAIISLLKPGDHSDIGMGTIIGSALFNILAIIGVSAAVKKAVLCWQPVVRDVLFYSLSIIILLITFWDGKITWAESILFTVLYVVYVIAVMKWKNILPYKEECVVEEVEKKGVEEIAGKGVSRLLKPFNIILDKFYPSKKHCYWVFFISIIIIALLSWVLVESAVGAAEILHIPTAIIALTILAAGTSVPDLLSSVIVARRGQGGMAISNAIGSNIFDILVGLGVPWFILLSFQGGYVQVSTENLFSSIILLFATVLVIFFLLLMRRWRIGYRAGYFLIGLYVMYLIWAISRAL